MHVCTQSSIDGSPSSGTSYLFMVSKKKRWNVKCGAFVQCQDTSSSSAAASQHLQSSGHWWPHSDMVSQEYCNLCWVHCAFCVPINWVCCTPCHSAESSRLDAAKVSIGFKPVLNGSCILALVGPTKTIHHRLHRVNAVQVQTLSGVLHQVVN